MESDKLLEIEVKMRECAEIGDKEIAHINADKLLCELLNELGFTDLVEIYDSIDKWYS